MTPEIHTFGCKVNTYDSGLLQKRLARWHGSAASRVHVLNTCAVTGEATREAVRTIRRLKARDPFCTVVVTGCAAQVDTDQFENLPGADLVIANSHKGQLENILDQHFRGQLTSRVFKSNIFHKEDLEAGGGIEEAHTRAFLKIQDGCNSFCSFCVIPFARGKSRSIPVRDLLSRARELSDQGVRELVLTGVHIGDYDDEGRSLEDLVETLCERSSISRIRLSSLEPIELSERLLQLHLHPSMCPHFHMSIQSANSKVLHEMRRKYGHSEVERVLTQIHHLLPEAFVGMDVIAGFPGESDTEFADGFERLRSLPWTRLHVFPYSERPGTKAALRDDRVPPSERTARARRLRELSSGRYFERAQAQLGTIHSALVLREASSDRISGLTRNYWPVNIRAHETCVYGQEVRVRITGVDDSSSRLDARLTAEVAQ